ncbi:uncharacterized protein K460DRAFT_376726 [Cucurbitaria berberidis CBS 394.84]|uniref:Rhodopsin domain-containing protein n=1 Tax=Cucurbitaria berberidis CBS 394.84 TaxID=1168544 RepID=A0A9P4L7R9_9PLEO|nr:uncharacterized protein K460DRAFT_376726 [Cucurbitaria berberidis CBS 394.84]KAF1845270.1 hypothetical protein K460DRAFT_376726 [Cucurbitaria berberidis CBS 394.84]
MSSNLRGQRAVNISTTFTIIAVVTVALRLYTRFFLVRFVGVEDYGIILAMSMLIWTEAKWGMGRHISDVSPHDLVKTLKVPTFWASFIIYGLSLGLTKGSILLQYQRVFKTKRFQIACWTVVAIVIGYTMSSLFSCIFYCIPLRSFWTREPARCVNQHAMWFAIAAINILTDFIIIILPMPVIRSLRLGRRQKTALTAIFAVGGFVCIVSILRLQSLVAISKSQDLTYDNPSSAAWSSIEVNVAIICSCLPLFRPLLARWLPGGFSSHKRSSHSSPRPSATSGSNHGRKGLKSEPEYPMNMMKQQNQPSEDVRDIQVITDIHVHVEGSEERASGWRTPISNKEWVDDTSNKETPRASSTNMVATDAGHAV